MLEQIWAQTVMHQSSQAWMATFQTQIKKNPKRTVAVNQFVSKSKKVYVKLYCTMLNWSAKCDFLDCGILWANYLIWYWFLPSFFASFEQKIQDEEKTAFNILLCYSDALICIWWEKSLIFKIFSILTHYSSICALV